MLTIYCQIGYTRNLRGGHFVSVYLNDLKVDIKDGDGGDYLTGVAERNRNLWYLKPLQCNNGDVIRIECKSGLRGLGPDEYKSFTAIFMVDDGAQNEEFKFPETGRSREFPLLNGKVRKISCMTVAEKRLEEAKAKLNKEQENG